MHSLTVTSPQTVKVEYHSIRFRGLNLLGKTVFLIGKHLNTERNFHRIYITKFINRPYVCSDIEALNLIELQEGIEHSPRIDELKINTGGDFIFNGYAALIVTVEMLLKREG